MKDRVKKEEVKEQGNEEVGWPQFPYTAEEYVKIFCYFSGEFCKM